VPIEQVTNLATATNTKGENQVIKYYAYFDKIKAVEIERESAVSVWNLRGSRECKKTDWSGYFDTWEEAKQFLLEVSQKEIDKYKRILQRARDQYGNIKGLKQD
jgi:hypothetical protein